LINREVIGRLVVAAKTGWDWVPLTGKHGGGENIQNFLMGAGKTKHLRLLGATSFRKENTASAAECVAHSYKEIWNAFLMFSICPTDTLASWSLLTSSESSGRVPVEANET
jgi:hypothetical protein